MKILLAIDGSDCSHAATQAVIAQFPHERAEVRVLHADDWPNRLPTSLAFAEGPTAASDILDVRDERRRLGEELVSHAEQQLRTAGFQTSTDRSSGRRPARDTRRRHGMATRPDRPRVSW